MGEPPVFQELSHVPRVEETVNDDLNGRLAAMFPDRTLVAFFIDATEVTPDGWMSALAALLRRRGLAAVGLLTKNSAPLMRLENMDAVFVVDPEDVVRLDRVDCFVVTDIERISYPATSRVLACMHASSAKPDVGEFLHGVQVMGSFDGYAVGFPFAHCRDAILSLWSGFTPPCANHRSGDDFLLMGFGHPRLCLSLAALKRKQDEGVRPEAICYAPSLVDFDTVHGGRRIARHGRRILRCLLDNFPDRNVIFRPAPCDRGAPEVTELLEDFAGEPRLLPDMDNGYVDTMARSAVVVSDVSHFGTSFHVLTRRPTIFFRPWEGRNLVGPHHAFCSSITAMVAMIRQALEAVRSGMESPPPPGYLPFENALEDLADALPDFIARRARDGWLAIPRPADGRGATTEKVVAALLRNSDRLALSAQLAAWFQSRPLALFALILHAQEAPQSPCDPSLLALAGCPAPADGLHGGISMEILAGRCMEESGAARRDGDAKSAILLATLADMALRREAIIPA